MDRALRNANKANLDLALSEMEMGSYNAENPADGKVSTAERSSAMQAGQVNLCGHRSGLDYLNALLHIAKSEIVSDGYISERIAKKIFFAFGLWDYVFASNCLYSVPPEAKAECPPSEKGRGKQAEQKHPDVIALIENRLKKLAVFEEYASEREQLAADAEGRSFSLPPADTTTSFYATRLTWIVNFIARWTSWSVYNDSAEAKPYRRQSTSIWVGGIGFDETKPTNPLLSAVRSN